MDEAERCGSRRVHYYGKLIADGTPNSLRENSPTFSLPAPARGNHHAGSHAALRLRAISPASAAPPFLDNPSTRSSRIVSISTISANSSRTALPSPRFRPVAPSLEGCLCRAHLQHQAMLEAARGVTLPRLGATFTRKSCTSGENLQRFSFPFVIPALQMVVLGSALTPTFADQHRRL